MTARSYLYAPAHRRDLLGKAAAGRADAVIADLEDGVAPAAKEEARRTLAAWLAESAPTKPVWVRVNNHPESMARDVAALAAGGIAGLYLPKATPASARAARDLLSLQGNGAPSPSAPSIIALIEDAEGLTGVEELAAMPFVSRLAIGEADLGADLGLNPALPEQAWSPIRLQLVVASAAHGLEPPIGPVLTDYTNDERLRASTRLLRDLGFRGRGAIHPRQVEVINDVFTPTVDEVAAARRLLERFEEARASGSGVLVLDDGTMADEATVRHARSVVALAERAAEGS